MRNYFSLLFILFIFNLCAQTNLISNPGFERSTIGKPSTEFNQKGKDNVLVSGWYQPTAGTSDYYNSDYSTVEHGKSVHRARSGQGRIGFVSGLDPRYTSRGYKEYIQTHFTEPMKKDSIYSVNFFFTLDKRCIYHSISVGAYISDTAIKTNTYEPLDLVPQIESTNYAINSISDSWNLLHGYYKAKGGEQYITIGSFGSEYVSINDNARSRENSMWRFEAYYYLDDVYVYQVRDTTSDDYAKVVKKNRADEPYNNLVLVLDVSSSMNKNDKIQTLKESVDLLLNSIDSNEIFSVITFDASPKVLAQGVKASQRQYIIDKIDSLVTGGGTNVNTAVQKAYNLINTTYVPEGNNRIVLLTDAAYQLSTNSKKIIAQNSSEKNIGFSTLVFGEEKSKDIAKICKKNKGTYTNVTSTTSYQALHSQVAERPKDDYTPEKTFKKSVRTALKVGIVVALVAILVISQIK